MNLRIALLTMASACLGACADDNSSSPNLLVMEHSWLRGPHHLSGTIELSEPLPEGTRVGLGLTGPLSPSSEPANDGYATDLTAVDGATHYSAMDLAVPAERVPFEVYGVADGGYLLSAVAFSNHDGRLDDDDMGGYYGGTTSQPALFGQDAIVLRVDRSLPRLDFGIGPITCLALPGDSCEADRDCRGTSCLRGGSRYTLEPGRCDADEGRCLAPTIDECDWDEGPGAVVVAGCLG